MVSTVLLAVDISVSSPPTALLLVFPPPSRTAASPTGPLMYEHSPITVIYLASPRFAVLGGSGGGPYALACAHALPCDMLSTVGIMGGAPPWHAGTQDLPLSSRATSLTMKYWPAGLRRLTDLLVRALRIGFATGPAVNAIEKWLEKNQQENDGDSIIEEQRERLLRMAFEGFAQGAEGFVHEARLLSQDWGFRFEDVAYNRIKVWDGTHDANAPLRMIRYMAGRLPHLMSLTAKAIGL